MMKKTCIKNADVVIPGEILKNKYLLIKNGKIADICNNPVSADDVIDAGGKYILPGFVDIHVHGGGGSDFMDGSEEAFCNSVKAHLKHGTTTLLPTAMTASEKDLLCFLKCYKDFKNNSSLSCITPGVHLEGPYFSGANSKSSGAQPSNLLRLPDENEIDEILNFANGDIIRWDAAPELDGIEMFADKMKKNGILFSIAHSAATSEEAQNGIDIGFSHVTHFYNAVTTYRKEGQRVLAGVVEAAYLNDNVCVELICDGRHIPRDILRLAVKIKGIDKVMAITDAMRIAGTDIKCGKLGSIENGTDVIVDDGVAKLPDLSSYAGSIATMDRCLKVLCLNYGFSLTDASVMLSKTPANYIGIGETKGSIEIGKDADILMVDKGLNVETVMLHGNIIY